MKLRTFLLGLSALLIASAAAFFSVTGLSKLFAGASLAVMLMAGSLEFGKLIAAGFLYNYWDKINKLLRTYLLIGVVTLILITSMGIYGFLTAAYQSTADELSIIDKQVSVIELRKQRYEEQLNGFVTERDNLSTSITELTRGLSNNVIQYTDSTGQLITTTSSATRRVLEGQLNDSKQQRDLVTQRIEALTDSVTNLDIQIIEIQQSSDLAAEVGPLKYMAEITGLPMANVVNIFALMIIFVFDPMAVTLVIAFNTALKVDKGEEDKKKLDDRNYQLYNDQKESLIQMMEGDEEDGLYDAPNEKLKNAVLSFKWDEDDDKTDEEIWENTLEDGLDDIPYEESQDETDTTDTEGEFHEYDFDKDGVVTEEELRRGYEEGGWRDPFQGRPYYHHPWFDWNKKERWINDRKAIDYWLNYRGGTRKALEEIKTKYPTDFESKTY